MEVSNHDDHLRIRVDAEQRRTFHQIIESARMQSIYAGADDVASMRKAAVTFGRFPLARSAPVPLEWRDIDLSGLPGLECRWPGDSEPARVLYFHGGGFVCGSLPAARGMIGSLCAALRRTVVAIGYRQAPEHVHPAALEDAHAGFAWISSRAAQPVLLIGESAGGLLALEAARRAAQRREQTPEAVVACSPWFDVSMSGRSWVENAARDIISIQMGRLFQSHYLSGQDPRAIWEALITSDFSRMPPVLIQVGELEMPLDDSRALASRVMRAGGRVTLEVYDGMPHGFVKFAGPVGDFALGRISSWFEELDTD